MKKCGLWLVILLLAICMLCSCDSKSKKTETNNTISNSVSTQKIQNNSKETESESVSSRITQGDSEKKEKNGFNLKNNTNVTVGNCVFSVPDYWDADTVKADDYRAYAETTGKVAVLQIKSAIDKDDPVSYEILKKEDEEGRMQNSFKSWFASCGKVTSENYSNGDIKGFIYSCNFTEKGINGKAKILVFPSEENNSWVYVELAETDNTEYTYFGDFREILDSITMKEEKSEPVKNATLDENGLRPEFKEAMDSYEEFFDEYIEFMNSFSESSNTMTMMSQYLDFLTKYEKAMSDMEAWESEDLNDAETLYFAQVQLRISNKLLSVQ